jgi:carbonic anhydrase
MRIVAALALIVISAQASTFTYETQDSWGEDFPDCNGKAQSPINLFTGMGGGNGNFLKNTPYDASETLGSFDVPEESIITGFHPLTQTVGSAVAGVFSNNGHTLMFTPTGDTAGSLISRGPMRLFPEAKPYELKQIHFHSPSEHTLNGKQYPFEMHMVHQNEDGAYAVVGVFFDDSISGESNSALGELLNEIPNVGDTREIQAVDLSKVTGEGPFYSYDGSFTTPPCTEGVQWFVYRHVKSMSTAQITKFNKYYRANNRDTQSINGRYSVLNGNPPFGSDAPELDCAYDDTLPHCANFDAN